MFSVPTENPLVRVPIVKSVAGAHLTVVIDSEMRTYRQIEEGAK